MPSKRWTIQKDSIDIRVQKERFTACAWYTRQAEEAYGIFPFVYVTTVIMPPRLLGTQQITKRISRFISKTIQLLPFGEKSNEAFV